MGSCVPTASETGASDAKQRSSNISCLDGSLALSSSQAITLHNQNGHYYFLCLKEAHGVHAVMMLQKADARCLIVSIRPPFCRYSFFSFCYVMMVLIFLKGILFDLLLIRSHLISD
jgi:hypothetical protein